VLSKWDSVFGMLTRVVSRLRFSDQVSSVVSVVVCVEAMCSRHGGVSDRYPRTDDCFGR
jgi:hypothetical protein